MSLVQGDLQEVLVSRMDRGVHCDYTEATAALHLGYNLRCL